MSTNGDEESTTPGTPSAAVPSAAAPAAAVASSAAAPSAAAPRYVASKRASWFVFLALLNVLGAVLLFFAVTKGEQATSSYDYGCPGIVTPAAQQGHLFSPGPSDTSGFQSVAPGWQPPVECAKPFAKPFWGLGAAPVVAVIVSGFLMSVLYDRRQRRLAVLQTGFFVLALGYAVYGVSSLVDFWI